MIPPWALVTSCSFSLTLTMVNTLLLLGQLERGEWVSAGLSAACCLIGCACLAVNIVSIKVRLRTRALRRRTEQLDREIARIRRARRERHNGSVVPGP
jgi:urocanate hydratase